MNRWLKLAILVGGAALLAATFIDTIAVIGRHIGYPLIGSIELMQAVVLVSGGIGVVIATVENSHARVRLLIDRLEGACRVLADRLSDALTLLFFLVLLAGATWIVADLWNAHEQSEVIGVPWLVLRIFANLCLLAGSVVLLARIFGKVRP